MNRLLLVDGNAILHRAYHALPPLTAPDGTLVNAVYGFASMLISLSNSLKPTHWAVAFDRAAPTFRKELFADYQAKRPKMDDGLVGQVELVHDLVRSFGIPIYEMDGFEADDVIGTVCEQVKSEKVKVKNDIDQVVIVTGDRDILQLVVDEKVLVYMPTKGLSEGKLYGEKEVVERLGIEPKLIADWKALAGDQSDNYPGVPGIGPKRAVELLKRFGSVEALYESLEKREKRKEKVSFMVHGENTTAIKEQSTETEIKDTLAAKLMAGKDSAVLGKNLATIRTDAPVIFDAEAGSIDSLACDTAIAKLEEFHFPSLIKRLTGGNESKEQRAKSTVRKIKKDVPEDNGQQQLF